MTTYHKIQTVFLRDPETNHKTLLHGAWAKPEFGYLQDSPWVFTEKVDGTNIRLIRDGLEVRGRTDRAQIPDPLRLECAGILGSPAFQRLGAGMVLYGEGYGGKIQKAGATYGPEQRFVLFDVKCGDLWLEREDVQDIGAALGIDVVPVVGSGTLHDMVDLVEAGITSTWGDFQAEGVIARPTTELRNRRGERVITKLKCRDFAKEAAHAA